MPSAIGMPKLGMTMNEGMVVAWPLAIGSPVEKGEIVLIIESEKAEVEIEAQASGFLRHIFVEPEETVPCGTLLGAITATADEPFDAEAFRLQHAGPSAPAAKPAVVSPRPISPKAPTKGAAHGKTPVTPAARKRARELDIEVTEVTGSGPGGRVTTEDVEEWAVRRANLVAVGDGVALDVPAVGEGETVMLLPGFGTDVSAFSQQIPFLAQNHRVLGVNPRGVAGSSAPASESYDVAISARDAAAVAAAGPVHVIGASLGAAVALELAITAPEKVRSLTLMTPFVSADARLLAVCDAWIQLAAEVGPETLAQTLLPWFFSPTFLNEPRRRARTLRGLTTAVGRVPAATLERSARGMRSWSGSRAADLASVKVPTLVIAAGGDLLTPGAALIAEAITGATLVVVPEAGHAVSIEAPDKVNQAIQGHLVETT